MKVLVAGTGLAGCLTALRLCQAGIQVDVIEKMSHPGGISITSGGGVRVSNNWQQTKQYMLETNNDTVPEDVVEDFSKRMQNITEYVQGMCDMIGADMHYETQTFMGMPNHHYGFTGWESLDLVWVHVPDVDLSAKYPTVVSSYCVDKTSNNSSKGLHLFHLIYSLLESHVDIEFNTALEKLIVENNCVTGAVINGEHRKYDAVVLATGGFENNPEMQKQYWQGNPVLPNGFFGNTGDGHRAASAVGADSWHMWHYHGTYGFRMPQGYGARIKGANVWIPGDADTANSLRPLHHILVDQQGRRFMNEYPPYITDTGHRALELYSAERVKHDRIPAYFISDEQGRQQGPWGSIRVNDVNNDGYWSDDNLREIELGIIKKFNTVKEMAEYIGCKTSVLERTINTYNQYCDLEEDQDYERPKSSLHKIQTAPYYVAEIYPVVGNTQGGPVHNKHRQVLDSYGDIIPGLYTAGECGSIFGHLYLSSGNLSECFTSSEAIVDHLTWNI